MARKTEMTVDQGRALLMLIRRDISQSERQNAAFGMLRVILQRKLVFADLYDFMDELSTLLLQTFDDSLRNHCARVLLNFLLNYPMADKRVDSTLTFLLKNIEYEEPSGRLALLHLLLNLVKNFPVEVGIARSLKPSSSTASPTFSSSRFSSPSSAKPTFSAAPSPTKVHFPAGSHA